MKKRIFKILYYISGIIMKILNKINIVHVKKNLDTLKIIDDYPQNPLYGKDTFKDIPISESNYDLSIIIPVYNSQNYLEKCVNSLVNQKTKYKYQIILINDGSTDASSKIVKDFENKYDFVYVINQENGGISVARNNGIRAASGKYLGFIDNDDWVTEDYIEKLLDRAYKTEADIVKCNHVNYSVIDDVVLGVIRHKDASIIGDFGLNIMEFKGYVWGGVIKKELFDKIRFPEGYWYEDIMMRFILMRKSQRYEHIDENLYFYAIHKSNASKNLWKKSSLKSLEFYILLQELLKINDEFGLKCNSVFYNQLLYELGPNLWLRTKALPRKIRHTIFLKACEMAKKYKKDGEFYDCNQYLSNAFETNNYLLWLCTSFHVICKVHIDYVK